MTRTRWFAILLIGLTLACGHVPESARDDRIIGVKAYGSDGDYHELFDTWQDLGINAVFAGENLASTPGFREHAAELGTTLFVIFPVFYAPDDLAADPNLWAETGEGERAKDAWVEFACPSNDAFRAKRVEQAVELVRRLEPDGLSIDFIRHFVFWEMVSPDANLDSLPDACYCRACLKRFAEHAEIDTDLLALEPPEAAEWIAVHRAEEWAHFKCRTITSVAEQIIEAVREIKPDILVNIHIVPWRANDHEQAITRIAGQDRESLGALADFLSPMAYSFMLRQPPEWVGSVVEDVASVTDARVLPSIQVATAYREGESLPNEEFEANLLSALAPPSAGVVFWSSDHIQASPDKAEIIRHVIRDTR